MRERAKPARNSRAAKLRVKFNWTLHQSSHSFATRVHGFATKTNALARKIPPATQANFSGKRLRFWSCGFVCQTKKVNSCGHVTVRYLTMAYSVNSKGQTLIHGKSINESLRWLKTVSSTFQDLHVEFDGSL